MAASAASVNAGAVLRPIGSRISSDALLAVPLDDPAEGWASAARMATLAARDARPLIALESQLGAASEPWTAQRDLLASGAEVADFVVEVDDARRAALRFGNDAQGKRPDADTTFAATYRIGNGSAGNVGAMALAHVVSTDSAAFVSIANPLPAFGGTEPEDVEAARRDAPQAFRTQERAVTADDYARAAERRSEDQRAAAIDDRRVAAQQAHEQRALTQREDRLGTVAHLDKLDRVGAADRAQHVQAAQVAAVLLVHVSCSTARRATRDA